MRIASVTDVAPGQARAYVVNDVPIVLVRTEDGEFHAIDEFCTHRRVSLADGEIDDATIECSRHGAIFDLRSGKPLCLPATEPLNVYPVTISGDDVLVSTTAEETHVHP